MSQPTINPSAISLEIISATTTAWVSLPTNRLAENEACYKQIYEPGVNFLVALDVVYAVDVFPTATRCLPVEVASWWLQDQVKAAVTTVTKLGPNFECPAMYSEVQVLLEPRASGAKSTAYIQCCPTGYNLATAASPKGFGPTQCTSAILKNQMITYAYNAGEGFIITSTKNTGTPSVVYAQHVNGYSVATTTSSSSSLSSSAFTTSTPSAQNVTTPASMETKTPESGLSTGATIGIGIGAALVGMIALLALVWFLVRRRKAKREAGGSNGEQQHVFANEQQHQQPFVEKGYDPTAIEIGSGNGNGNGGIAHSHFEPAKVDPKDNRPYELQ